MIIVTAVLYILGILLALIVFFFLFFLIIPFRYKVRAGYGKNFWFNFSLRCSPAFILTGGINDQGSMALKLKFILFGIPIRIDPKKFGKKEKAEKEKKESKKIGFRTWLAIFDKELRVRGIALVKDLLLILKPDRFYLKGRIGFDEPHLTGWLAAITNALKYCCKKTFVDLKPVWEDEHYEFNACLKGRIISGLILAKIGWFFLKVKTRHLFKKTTKTELAANN